LTPIFMISTKCIDPRILQFVVSKTGSNKSIHWTVSCISLDFHFRGEPWTPSLE